VRRFLLALMRALGTLGGIWLLVNLLPRFLPEDAARIAAGEWATDAEVQAMRHLMGLDLSWHHALLRSLGSILRGDFGWSLRHQCRVTDLLIQGFPVSLRLALLALTGSVLLAFLLALGRSRFLRYLQAVAIASPVYVLGPILLWMVAQHVPWIPVAGIQGWTAWILPSLALAVPLAGHQARILSIQLEEVRESAGLRWWQGCGVPSRLRYLRWALPGISGPWLTILGLQLGALLGGAVLVETIFAIPGLGQLLVGALSSRDLPVVQGAVMLGASLYVLTQLLVEGCQTMLDPRLR
jgi:ABC-type dipeptide/oligopeptide/nickel transport system permease component